MNNVWYDTGDLPFCAEVSEMSLHNLQPLANQCQEPYTRYVTVKPSKAKKSNWQITDGFTLERKITVEAQVPCVKEVTSRGGWFKLSKNGIFNGINCIDAENETSVPLTAPPLKKTHFTVKYLQVVTEHIPFKAVLNCTLDNGSIFSLDVKGLYSGVSNSDLFVESSKTVANWNSNAKSLDEI